MCESSLYATAVHEAGHAVIGRVLGMLCGHVTIDADEDSSGHGIVDEPYAICSAWEQRGRYREMSTVIIGRIMTFMAGAESEVEILGSCRGGDDGDRYQIRSMMLTRWCPIPNHGEPGDEAWIRYESRLRARTRGLVCRHRDKIRRVANALLIRRTLSGDEVEAVIRVG
jgi:ATP-dependent Zn protease